MLSVIELRRGSSIISDMVPMLETDGLRLMIGAISPLYYARWWRLNRPMHARRAQAYAPTSGSLDPFQVADDPKLLEFEVSDLTWGGWVFGRDRYRGACHNGLHRRYAYIIIWRQKIAGDLHDINDKGQLMPTLDKTPGWAYRQSTLGINCHGIRANALCDTIMQCTIWEQRSLKRLAPSRLENTVIHLWWGGAGNQICHQEV